MTVEAFKVQAAQRDGKVEYVPMPCDESQQVLKDVALPFGGSSFSTLTEAVRAGLNAWPRAAYMSEDDDE